MELPLALKLLAQRAGQEQKSSSSDVGSDEDESDDDSQDTWIH